MTESVASQPRIGMIGRDQAHALFAQTMGYVAVTAGSFALGAWPGRHLAGVVASWRSLPVGPAPTGVPELVQSI